MSKVIDITKVLRKMEMEKYFECTFVKKDGSIRNMKCIYESDKSDSNYIIVFDIENNGYRNVNLATLIDITIKNTTFKILKR